MKNLILILFFLLGVAFLYEYHNAHLTPDEKKELAIQRLEKEKEQEFVNQYIKKEQAIAFEKQVGVSHKSPSSNNCKNTV